MKVGLKKYLMTSANFFRFVGPGSPNFFVLWGPDRQLFSFCGARITNFFRFPGSGSPETKKEKLKSTRKRQRDEIYLL